MKTWILCIDKVLFFFLILLYFSKSFSQNIEFNQQKEFPNYFQEIPNARIQLEAAMNSIFNRLTVPIVVNKRDKVTKNVKYFPYVTDHIHKIDKDAQVMPSGGVVRSALSYIYKEIHTNMKKNPPISPAQTLQAIIISKHDLPGYKIRGVGSDFDILIRNSNKTEIIASEVLRITNSAENLYRAKSVTNDVKKSLFTIGDVKEYGSQILRATSQGGSTIDFSASSKKKAKQKYTNWYVKAKTKKINDKTNPPIANNLQELMALENVMLVSFNEEKFSKQKKVICQEFYAKFKIIEKINELSWEDY